MWNACENVEIFIRNADCHGDDWWVDNYLFIVVCIAFISYALAAILIPSIALKFNIYVKEDLNNVSSQI